MVNISLDRQSGLQDRKINQISFILATLLLYIALFTYYGFATDGLTDVLTSDEVRGSQKYLNWMSWYGVMANATISIISLLGMVQCIITFITTLVYYASPPYWDYVASLKENQSTLASGNIEGFSAASGLDAIVDAINSMNINIRKYSDASTEFDSNMNIDEYTTGWEYMMKKGPVILIAILFLNMGWKGVLQKMIAVTVDAITVYAEALPYQKVVDFAEWKAAQESGYEFTLGLSGSEEGKIKEKLAREIFGKVQSTLRYTAKEDIEKIGGNIEAMVANIETKFRIPKHMQSAGTQYAENGTALPETKRPEIWPQLSIRVGVASTTAAKSVNDAVYIKFSDIVAGAGTSHRNKAADEAKKQHVVLAMSFREYTDGKVFMGNKTWKLDKTHMSEMPGSAN